MSGVNSTFANIVIRYCRDLDLDHLSKAARNPREISSARGRTTFCQAIRLKDKSDTFGKNISRAQRNQDREKRNLRRVFTVPSNVRGTRLICIVNVRQVYMDAYTRALARPRALIKFLFHKITISVFTVLQFFMLINSITVDSL